MRNAQGVQGNGQATERGHEREKGQGRRAGDEHRRGRDRSREKARDGDHDAAIENIRQMADGPLQQRAAEQDGGHEERDLRHGQARALGVHGTEAEQHAAGHARGERADHAEG